MGEAFGIPEWAAATIFVGGFLLLIVSIAWRNTKRQIARTLAKRANPTKAEFLNMMSSDASSGVSEFIWESGQPLLDLHGPTLTIHPEDSLVADLPIDEDEWSLDWPAQWAELNGICEGDIPDWPDGGEVTVRNYARWLDLAVR